MNSKLSIVCVLVDFVKVPVKQLRVLSTPQISIYQKITD